MAAIPAPQQQNRDPRMARKVDEIIQILVHYYPEVQFFRKLLLFEYFPLTILFYGIIHLVFYYISTTEDSLVSILILFGVIALITWKVGIQVVLPTYLTSRKRTMGKRGKTPEMLQEEDAYTHRLAHRFAIIALIIEDIKCIMMKLHTNEPIKFLCIMSTIGAIFFLIGSYIPGVVVSYLIIIFLLIWPILVHNKLPQVLDGFYQVLAPRFAVVKEQVVEKAKLIPHPKLSTADIVPLSREELPTAILEQSLVMGKDIHPPQLFQQQYYTTRPQYMPAHPQYPPPQTYYTYPPTSDMRYYPHDTQESQLRQRTNLAPLPPNTPPASHQQREINDAMQAEDEFGRPYTLGDDEFEMVDGSQIPNYIDP